jgi:hypothetical protein
MVKKKIWSLKNHQDFSGFTFKQFSNNKNTRINKIGLEFDGVSNDLKII